MEQAELASLHPEQQALVDFLVLVRSRNFVGVSVSTFSVFIREYRHIHDIAPRSTSFFVDGTRIGTESLFAHTAVLN
jgi:GDP-fucose protein O-fucosyltransferase